MRARATYEAKERFARVASGQAGPSSADQRVQSRRKEDDGTHALRKERAKATRKTRLRGHSARAMIIGRKGVAR